MKLLLLDDVQGNNFGSCQDAIICQQDATSNTACGNIFHVVKNQFQDSDGRNKFYPMWLSELCMSEAGLGGVSQLGSVAVRVDNAADGRATASAVLALTAV